MGLFHILMLLAVIFSTYGKAPDEGKQSNAYDDDDDDVNQEKLEASMKELINNLQLQGLSIEDLLNDAKVSKLRKSYEEEFLDTCGSSPLTRCPRKFEPIKGHVCENTQPIEPKGPFCNCPDCVNEDSNKKKIREANNFDEMEALKSDQVSPKVSIYNEKWKAPKIETRSKAKKLKPHVEKVKPKPSNEEARRNLFSCQKTEPIYNVGKIAANAEPDFREQLKSIEEDEQNPSRGIVKYLEKARREEGEL